VKALVTRPEEEAAPLAASLGMRGVEPVLEPLIRIRFAEDGARLLAPMLAGAQAVLFTSANGVRAFAAATTRRDLAAYAVGDATASAARQAGFSATTSAGGNVESLAALVRERVRPADGALVHAAGSAVAGDLAAMLGGAGFELRRAVLYEAEQADAFGPDVAAALAAGAIGVALFFSPRTAETFARLVREAGLEAQCAGMIGVALSPAVAIRLAGLIRTIHVARAPTMNSLLEALDRALAGPR
jgi:uroporphyrinogen-III synthase